MADLISDITAAIKDALATINGLNAHAEQPDTVNTPAAWPRLARVTYDVTQSGGGTLAFEVVLMVAPFDAGGANAQRKTWPYLAPTGAQSVKQAVEADQTLGGLCDQVIVSAARDLNSFDVNGIEYVGVIFDVEVWV